MLTAASTAQDLVRLGSPARVSQRLRLIKSRSLITMMYAVLITLNGFVSLASVGWAFIAMIRPASLSGSHNVDRGEIFYARLYAARSIPFGLASAILPLWSGGSAIAWVLFMAAAIQAADVGIAMAKKERGMIVGASIATGVHLLCGLAIL